jgi:hypothetical protein
VGEREREESKEDSTEWINNIGAGFLICREFQKEFDSIQQARDVVAKLNELEALVADADRRRKEAGGGEPPIP